MGEKLFLSKRQLRGILSDGLNREEIANYLESYGITLDGLNLKFNAGDVITVTNGSPVVIDEAIVKSLFTLANNSSDVI